MDTIVTPVTVVTIDSTRIIHNAKADFVARHFPPVVRLVQYDKSLPVIAVELLVNGQPYTLPTGAGCNIRVHKPDATYVYNGAIGCDSTRTIVYFEVTQNMAAANGDGLAIVELVVNGDIAGTSLINLHFEENPVPEDAIESSDEWETIYELGQRIIASTVTPVSNAADMTDTDRVYLYTGTETGWNQGHMYYYNGSTWVDAGIAVTDKTLSVSDMAADAKTVGDRLTTLDSDVANLKASDTTQNADISALKEESSQILNSAYVTDTASGAIASFPDGADGVPVKSLTVNIEPVQSGSGDPSPDNVRPISGHTQAVVTRTGKNLANENSGNNIVIGTARKGHTYTFSCANSGNIGVNIKKNSNSGETVGSAIGTSNPITTTFTADEDFSVFINGYSNTSGSTFISLASNYQLELGSTATAYEPYNEQTVTIDLGGTRYGGTLDVTTGVLTVDRAYFKPTSDITVIANSSGWNPHYPSFYFNIPTLGVLSSAYVTCISNVMKGVKRSEMQTINAPFACAIAGGGNEIDFTSTFSTAAANKQFLLDNNVEFCYKRSSPLTVQLTANEISTLLGTNNIWSDAGTVDVEYRADTKLYIEKLTAPTEDDMIADHAISANSFFMVGNTLYRATTAIASGATITVGTNATKLSLSDALNALA